MVDIFGQIERWREQLLDISKRNRLINCRIGGRGALRLDHPTPDVIWSEMLSGSSMIFRWKSELIEDEDQAPNGEEQTSLLFDELGGEGRPQPQDDMQACLGSPLLKPTELLTEMTDKRLGGRLSRLSLNARTTLSEQGVNSLFLAFGMLRWYESIDSDVAIRSPLLLVPVSLHRSGVDKPWTLSLYEEEVHPNHSLNQIMKSSFNMELPEFAEDSLLDADTGRTDYFNFLTDSFDDKSRWEIENIAVLGTFSFQKIAMWNDLGTNAEHVATHGMCQAIAGEDVPDLTTDVELPSPREFDSKLDPKDLHLILDADSSQLEALVAAKNGLNLVVDGPPGTGKSQTIANIIAECLASDKTVLFVSEKAAALEVVKHRLDQQRLGDFCLECHSHKANKKEVIGELGRCLALPQERYRDQTDDLDRLYETRQVLNAYVDALHLKRSQLKHSAFQVHGLLAEIHTDAVSRCEIPNVLDVDAATLRRITTALDRLSLCREVIANPDTHPWRGCSAESHSLTLEDDIRHHFRVLAEKCANLSREASPLVDASLCPETPSKHDVDATVVAIRQMLELPRLPSEWFERDPHVVAKAFAELNDLTTRYRSLLESMNPIREDSFEEAAGILAALGESNSMTSRIRLGSAKLSLRKREHERLLDLLGDVQVAVQTVQHELSKVTKLMHVTLNEPSLRLLGKLLTFGKLVARVGLAHESWFEPPTRKKLLQDAEECIDQLAIADHAKENFGGRLTRFAYEDEGNQVAERFTQFESFWARWFKGGWKQLREEAADFYKSEPPARTATWLQDMRNLRRFHRRRSQITRITEANADTLLREEDGTADWKNLFTILSALEAMQDEFKVPPSLRQALTTKGAIDREALEMVVVDLEIALTQLDGKMASLNEAFDTVTGVGNKNGYRDLSDRGLREWVDDATDAVTDRVKVFSDLESCLQDGQDISLADKGVYRNVLSHTLDAKQQVDARLELLGELTQFEGSPYIHDWHAEAELAKTCLWYFANASTTDDPAFTPLLHDSSLRELCETAVQSVEFAMDEAFQSALVFLDGVFDLSKPVSTGIVIADANLHDLQEWLNARAEDVKRVHSWIEYNQIQPLLRDLRVSTVLTEVENSTVAVADATDAFRLRFYRLWLDEVYASDPTLSRFNVDEHEQLIGSFRELDVSTTDAAFKRIRSRLLNDPQRPHIGMVNAPSTSEVGLLLHEVNKKRRHKSLRRLFKDLPTLLTRLKPCVMVSPLAVSTYFESDDVKFDVVIFDEASQVRPFDAIGAIYRGRQLIVAGDQKQLPPTTFFDKLAEDDGGDPDDEGTTDNLADFESILDVCCMKGLPRKRLRWHYRSRREPLIGFSNHHFYDNELVTFPSVDDVDGTGAVDFEFVEEGRWKVGSSGGYNLREAEHTARLIVEHFSSNPDQSLGVITFNQKQQLAVLDQLTLLRKNRPQFDKFFDEENGEPFFVKNLENVQGDERDVIFLSMGYGRERSDKPPAMRFGPLNRLGGERRLNVAVTRAKHHVKMIASIKSHDIDLNRTNSVGARLLKHYLEYAERGTEVLGAEITDVHGDDFDSPFEREVAEELRRQGFDTRTQVGCSGFRIDLAIVHPDEPGRYVLGIECDGATYHSSATARDRDRLRQSVLENLGWHIYRIWSTDWVRDPQRQIQRVRDAYEAALYSPKSVAQPRRVTGQATVEVPQTRHPEDDDDLYGRFGHFDDISKVGVVLISDAIKAVLKTYGATDQDELCKSVSRGLGFMRIGSRIRSAIDDAIARLDSRREIVVNDDNTIRLPNR